ncbi:unnamed protein product, partial [Timema podura]|nr:unnamed protein product [Timema podura]
MEKYLKMNQRVSQRFQEFQMIANENALAAAQKIGAVSRRIIVEDSVVLHVATMINLCRDQGLSPRPPAQKSDTLPLDRQ